MPKSRIMGAGLSGSSAYNISVNSNQGGGNKKGGLPGSIGLGINFAIRRIKQHAYSSPEQRTHVYCINQIGGVGSVGGRSRRYVSSADGVKDCDETKGTETITSTSTVTSTADQGPMAGMTILFVSDRGEQKWSGANFDTTSSDNYNSDILYALVKNPHTAFGVDEISSTIYDSDTNPNPNGYLAITDDYGVLSLEWATTCVKSAWLLRMFPLSFRPIRLHTLVVP